MIRSPLTVVALGALAFLTCCSKPADPSKPSDAGATKEASPPPLVRVAPVEIRPVRRTIETTSYLESEHRVAIQSKIAGRVLEVTIDVGAPVKSGQVLARLDDREAQSAAKQVEVQLADRRVRLELAKLEAQAAAQRVDQARIEHERAKSQHERNLQIDPGLIAEKELEDSRFNLEAAAEGLKVATVQQRKAELEVDAAKNAIDESSAKLEAERIKLAEHVIQAPFDGVIADRRIRGGETISASTELFVVVDDESLVSFLRRPQRELGAIAGAKEVTFTTDAVPDHEFRAGIDVILPTVDETTGSFRIRIRVHRDDDLANVLRPGMFIRAKILTEDQREALMVPKPAVLNEGAQSVVFVVRDGIARRVVLEPGIEERDFVECRNTGADGIERGAVVIVSGQQSLSDATAVEVARD